MRISTSINRRIRTWASAGGSWTALFLAVLAMLAWAPRANAQTAYGYSSLDIGSSYVTSYSETDIDYYTEPYYDIETDAYLWAGTSLAASESSSGPIGLETPTYVETSYMIQTNHWVIPVSESPYCFGCVATGDWYSGSLSVTADSDEEDGDEGSVYLGTTYATGDTDGSPPSITGVDYTMYGNELRGTTGYVILYGTNFTTPYGSTSVSFGFGSPSYVSQTQINLYYSIPADTSSGTYSSNIDVSTPYSPDAYTNFYVYDPQPTITSVSPSTWTAGTGGSVTIGGYYFGSNSSVSFSGDSFATVTKVSQSGEDGSGYGTITATYGVNAIDPGSSPTLAVSASSYSGSGFLGVVGGAGGVSAAFQLAVNPAPSATISRGGTNITGTTISVVVGQQISLTGAEYNLPTGVSVSSRSWTIQGNRISNYVISNGSGVTTAFSDSGTTSIMFYWIAAGTNTVTYTATLSNATTITATATFSVTSPSLPNYSAAAANTPAITCCTAGLLYPINFTATVQTASNQAGQVGYIQLITPNRSFTLSNGTVVTLSSAAAVLDSPSGTSVVNAYPYPASVEGDLPYGDAPGITGFPASTPKPVNFSDSDSFNTYVVYQPSGANSIWVTIGVLSWNWSASASNSAPDGSGSWSLNSGWSAASSWTGGPSSSLPQWSAAVGSLSFH